MTTSAERELSRIKQKVEELAGERGNSPALRVKTGLSQQSKTIDAAPTQEDYNALVADLKTLFQALGAR